MLRAQVTHVVSQSDVIKLLWANKAVLGAEGLAATVSQLELDDVSRAWLLCCGRCSSSGPVAPPRHPLPCRAVVTLVPVLLPMACAGLCVCRARVHVYAGGAEPDGA
jgi:hypothetical protein